MVNVGLLVNRRMELKKQGKLHEELVSAVLTWYYSVWRQRQLISIE